MSPGQSFEAIAALLERASDKDLDPRIARGLIVQAHTHAILQAATHRRRELRAEVCAYLETGMLQ